MRRFLITSPAFNGEADILFDDGGRLIKIDMSGTNMSLPLVQSFKVKLPAHVQDLQEAFAKSNATIVESTYEVDFADFWKAYDKKVNKKRCEPLWAKLSMADRIKAVAGVPVYKKYLSSLNYPRAIADPEKYLRDRYWENEWK